MKNSSLSPQDTNTRLPSVAGVAEAKLFSACLGCVIPPNVLRQTGWPVAAE